MTRSRCGRFIGRFRRPDRLWACYETGYELHRLLTSMGVRCDVTALSLIPKRRGDHVKTDKRDARSLAGLHRAGEVVAGSRPRRRSRRGICTAPAVTWWRI
jgi:transposase